ncbi:hypothetical protein JG687_00006775 [Phytophthora cactorum]|uniref:Uncharacterized protein n=1 Tax=Phytophthora cactorum TaxID=29920 RepID=A0A8T1UIN3_9STRA|nr:hypothetical protein JG687_00006775 [Phytophthora cactorum]
MGACKPSCERKSCSKGWRMVSGGSDNARLDKGHVIQSEVSLIDCTKSDSAWDRWLQQMYGQLHEQWSETFQAETVLWRIWENHLTRNLHQSTWDAVITQPPPDHISRLLRASDSHVQQHLTNVSHSANLALDCVKASMADYQQLREDWKAIGRRMDAHEATPKDTGKQISESMRVVVEAQESIAATILTRHSSGRQLACSDEAIKMIKNMLADKVPVQRYRFTKWLATEPNAATMVFRMDDKSREYEVSQYLLADNSDSDGN